MPQGSDEIPEGVVNEEATLAVEFGEIKASSRSDEVGLEKGLVDRGEEPPGIPAVISFRESDDEQIEVAVRACLAPPEGPRYIDTSLALEINVARRQRRAKSGEA
jgi:hypothetical protein